MKFNEDYIQGFVEVCNAVGLSEKQASVLLEVAASHEDLKDESFRNGFIGAMEKAADRHDFFMPDLQGAFSAPQGDIAKGMKGFGIGGALGGGLALASLLKPSIGRGPGGRGILARLNPSRLPMFNRTAVRGSKIVPDMGMAKRLWRATGSPATGMAMPLKNKSENLLSYGARRLMGPGNSRLAWGAGLGGAAGAAANIKYDLFSGYGHQVPAMDHWLPDNISASGLPGTSNAQAPSQGGSSSISRNPSSPYDPIGSFDVNTTAGATAGLGSAPLSNPVDTRIQDLRNQMDNSGTIQGALANNRLRKQIADLERQRVDTSSLNSINGGNRRSELAHAGQSIADKLFEVERAIKDRESRAGHAAAWMERTGGPTTIGNMLPQLWNKVVGNEAGAQQISAELQQLYRSRDILNQQLSQSGQGLR